MGLSECMKLVARMSQADQDELVQRVDDYIATGVAPAQAQRMAANDLLAEIEDDRREVSELADREIAARAPAEQPADAAADAESAVDEGPAHEAPQAPSPEFAPALAARLGEAKTNAGDSDYWLKRIDAAAQSGVVDRKDVKLSGIEGWLREQGGKIRKDAVLEWLDNAIANGSAIYADVRKAHRAINDGTGQFRQPPAEGPSDLSLPKTDPDPARFIGDNIRPGAAGREDVPPYSQREDDGRDTAKADPTLERWATEVWNGARPKIHNAVLASRAPHDALLMGDAPGNQLGRNQPVVLPDHVVVHMRARHAQDGLAPRDIARIPDGLAHPRAVLFKPDGAFVVLPATAGGDKPLGLSIAKAVIENGREVARVTRIQTLYSMDNSLRAVVAEMKKGSRVWLPSEEVRRVSELLAGFNSPQTGTRTPGWPNASPTVQASPGRGRQAGQRPTAKTSVLSDEALSKMRQGSKDWSKYTVEVDLPQDLGILNGARFSQREDGWTAPAPTKLDRVIYELQDKQVDLKRVTDEVRKSVGELTDRQDAYLREELFHGRVADRTARFLDREIKPLTVEMRAAGVTLAELEEYLHARHARERNAAMRAINTEREDNEALSGMSDADAAQILRDARPVMPRLALRVDAMIEGTRNLLEVSGLETPETVQALRDAYDHYVPLHRDEAHADSRQLIGSGFNVKGSNLKRATGSTARVTHILSHIIEQREAAIVRAEKNLVGMALYSMALKAPNPDFWKADTPPKIKVIDQDGQVQSQADPNYKRRDNVLTLKVAGKERTVTFNERDERALRMVLALKNLDADALDLVSGAVAHGTRWLASVNTQYNPVFALTNGIRDLQGAMVNLTSTPVNGKQAQIIHDAFRHAYAAVWRAERAGDTHRRGFGTEWHAGQEDGAHDEWVRLYRELSAHGGLTGWRDSYASISDRAKALQGGIDSLDDGAVKRAGKAALELVADLNSSVENGIRLAVYKAALDSGLSKDRAASVAKNITVNFNRKGRMGRTLGAWYAFLNASVQGTARLAQTLKGPAGKYIVLGGIGLGVLQAAMLSGMSDDDDEALQDFEREKNLIFPLGNGKYAKVPLALGLHVLPNIGRHLGEMAFAAADGKRVDATRHLTQLFGTLFDAFSPVGGAADAVQVIAPSVVDPLVQLAQNKDFAGRPIYRERSEFTGFKSGASLGKDSTNPAYRVLAEWINRISGGEDGVRNLDMPRAASPQPEALRFIVETLGGGVWREAERLIDAMIAAATPGGQVEPNRLPLGGRFYGDLSGPLSPTTKFYDNLNEIQAAAKAVEALKKSDDPRADEKIEDLIRRRPEAGLADLASRVRRSINELHQRRHQMLIDGATDAELRALDEEAAQVMRDFNEAARESRKPSK